MNIGSVSEGTLRVEDLIVSIFNFLDRELDLPEALEDIDIDFKTDILSMLMDLAQDHCPMYTYFGSSMGDGASIGVWVDVDALEEAIHDGEVIKVNDPNEVGDEGVYLFENDHGNLTLYVDGAEEWSIV